MSTRKVKHAPSLGFAPSVRASSRPFSSSLRALTFLLLSTPTTTPSPATTCRPLPPPANVMAGLLGAQFEQLIDERINQRLTVFKQQIEQRAEEQEKKLAKELDQVQLELKKAKQTVKDLRLTLDNTSSLVANQGTSFASLQKAVDGLQDVLNGTGGVTLHDQVLAIQQACNQHSDSMAKILANHDEILEQLGTYQSGYNEQKLVLSTLRDALNGTNQPRPQSEPHLQTAPPTSQDGVARASSAPTVGSINVNADDLPTRPSSARPEAAEHQVHSGGDPSESHQRSMISSNTFGEMSPQTAYTHQPTSSAVDAMDMDDEADEGDEADDEGDEDSSTIAVAVKRRGVHTQGSDADSATSTPGTLKRRRAASNLRQASADPSYHASSEAMLMQSPITSQARDAQLQTTASSDIEMPSWFNDTTEQDSPTNPNPLEGWASRAGRLQGSGAARMPRVSARPAEERNIEVLGGTVADSQRRSSRPSRPKKPDEGQILYPRDMPDLTK
ncbi:hypothetical protein M409DRAFT_57817 [Zasmidium cellare ATCC 36951]|uniref:Uncharacterized protein n=1 Tax=Zasmidium cellare ATCC 36951 TaxID=1080233 RepID=A0A6A6C8J1_ZASCE|nr:uncharacterized protein M409DRAFT_57817 [Zasmidium cellare ATCC 36951]KAF2163153.1 hypothetical protein M409DRAFT_57817 [Zasmidium cellare ATCC 36951]